ncbi:MAG TPA: chemotaxis protein CheA [Gemmatimonadales bacterium]|nr:chemotaxis protein CheA [Gemmatimonadales bacterium]
MDVGRYADLFVSESREHLTAFNHLLLAWERDPQSAEPVDGLFRAVHSVKGMAATMGYAGVAELAHRTENLLDVLRRSAAPVTEPQLELLFRAADTLERAVAAAVAGHPADPAAAALSTELDAEVARTEPAAQERRRASRPSLPVVLPGAGPAKGPVVRVVLRADAPLKGARATLVLQRAEALGAVQAAVPAPAAFVGDAFDGRFRFRLDPAAPSAESEAAVRAAGDVEQVEVAQEAPAEARFRHIRVDLRRLDALMNLIGELVLARGRLAALAHRLGDPDLDDVTRAVERLSGSLQHEIIQARMVPVWQVFDRFPRMVRDLARQMGRDVAFRVEGKEIELDRAILDEIAEPLVHLLRNAVDHGIEPPAARAASGKPAVGQLVLAAVRERSSVAISVRDDGRGIDRAAVLRRSRELGLGDAGEGIEQVGDELLFHLIAQAGFTTAEHVTDVSGRGVGIDAVASAVRALGGSVELQSEVGAGTTFTVRLPATLAIVRALLARVGGETYAVPITHVAEAVDPRHGEVRQVDGREALVLRGRTIPLVRLRELLGVSGGETPPRQPIIVLEIGERRTGVVVDAVLGHQEIVVKPFQPPRGTPPLFSGATILGDGAPALILDAGGLI